MRRILIPVDDHLEVVEELALRYAQCALLQREALTHRQLQLLDACISYTILNAPKFFGVSVAQHTTTAPETVQQNGSEKETR